MTLENARGCSCQPASRRISYVKCPTQDVLESPLPCQQDHNCVYGTEPRMKKKRTKKEINWFEEYERKWNKMMFKKLAAYSELRKLRKMWIKSGAKYKSSKLGTLHDPVWFHNLSGSQVQHLEFLAEAIRLDTDENSTERTQYVLASIGLYPRPRRTVVKKCIRSCNYNSIKFLGSLLQLTQTEDRYKERQSGTGAGKYSWNDRLLMTAVCHLEFPQVLRSLINNLPPLPYEQILQQIPYPAPSKAKQSSRTDGCVSPYLKPVWVEPASWNKEHIDRINLIRAHMETKRIVIPALALVHRPSLIDARPPFNSQISTMENQRRRQRPKGHVRGKGALKENCQLDSKIDVAAVAEVSDEIDEEPTCIFLRKYKPLEDTGINGYRTIQDKQDIEVDADPLIKHDGDNNHEQNQVQYRMNLSSKTNFREPPKTLSGVTIQEPCHARPCSPSEPAQHYLQGKRYLKAMIGEECVFSDIPVDIAKKKIGTEFIMPEVSEELKNTAVKIAGILREQQAIEVKYKQSKYETQETVNVNRKKYLKEGKIMSGEYLNINGPYQHAKNRRKNGLEVTNTPMEMKIMATRQLLRHNNMKTKVQEESNDNANEERKEYELAKAKVAGLRRENVQPQEIYQGCPLPLVKCILANLATKGLISTTFEAVEKHPDIKHLLQYLQGEVLTKSRKEKLMQYSLHYWDMLLDYHRSSEKLILDLPVFKKQLTYDDKKWAQKIAQKAQDKFLFLTAKKRAELTKLFYPTTFPEHFQNKAFLTHFHTYLVTKFEDSKLLGVRKY